MSPEIIELLYYCLYAFGAITALWIVAALVMFFKVSSSFDNFHTNNFGGFNGRR